MRQLMMILLVSALSLMSCTNFAYRGYPPAVRPYVKLNKNPLGANIITIKYLECLRDGMDEDRAIKEARDYYVKMLRYLEEHNPEHLYNTEIPKMTKI